jgi:hypothetical protein
MIETNAITYLRLYRKVLRNNPRLIERTIILYHARQGNETARRVFHQSISDRG